MAKSKYEKYKKKPYKLWDRDQLFAHLIDQCLFFGYKEEYIKFIKDICFDERWSPDEDFNGCNLVQDDLHPFLPCFIHDWRWITNQDAYEADIEFRDNLKKCEVSPLRANIYFIAVRIGWLLYYKWKK